MDSCRATKFSSSLPHRRFGVTLRKARIQIAVLDTHDPELRILVGRGAYGAICGGCANVKTFDAWMVRGVDRRPATKNHTVGVHRLSYCFEMRVRG
jgi:hypothetical protein